MQGLFMVIGFLTTIVIIVFLVIALIAVIKDGIEHLRIKHIQNHRFDKPPTAKCYCRDCKRWNIRDGNGYCEKFKDWCTADSWFCWDAEPTAELRKYD